MIISIIYTILALLGISFLIFIHELGHYFMARRVGITVEVFSIGLGKSLLEWQRKGVKWKLGCLPFGGYVRMAGMEKQGAVEPHQIPGGFFAAKPIDRIKVAFAGPVMNILFTLVVFTFIWAIGGREKPFSAFTHYIGWVERDSGLYEANIRAGDEITQLNNRPFTGFIDFFAGKVLDKSALKINGLEIDYLDGSKIPFTYTFPPEKNLQAILPAEYLIYDKLPDGSSNDLSAHSSMLQSGISNGDRILWVDGELIFSRQQLIHVINSPQVLLTVEREGSSFLTRVPRLAIQDLRLSSAEKEELDDWRYEAKLLPKIDQLAFIPYNLNAEGVIEGALSYIDERSLSQENFESSKRSYSEVPLQQGDKIVAVQGQEVTSAYQLLKELQTKKSLIVVQKVATEKIPNWKEADQNFESSFDTESLQKIIESIGTDSTMEKIGDMRLLAPVTPTPLREMREPAPKKSLKQKKQNKGSAEVKESDELFKDSQLKQITSILPSLNRLALNIRLQDKTVMYNPSPIALFVDVVKQTYRTLAAVVTGFLSPKHIMGPVSIVHVIHDSWSFGVKEAFFWLGMISANLAIMNLLPIPVLDGGHIVLATWEAITKKPLKAKTMERLILPFVILLIALFVYLTYNDLVRLFSRLFE